jgi:N utilization substance protein B
MLGRRSLRTKTMQHLYAFELNKDNSLSGIESQLQKSCDKTTDLFLTLLTYLYEIGQYSLVDAGIKMAKYIKKEDEIINTQLAAVPVLKNLFDHQLWMSRIKSEKINSYIDHNTVKHLFFVLRDKTKYKEFISKAEPNHEDFKDILSYIIKKVMSKDKQLEGALEENFQNADDDLFLLFHLIQKYIDGLKDDNPQIFIDSIKTWEDEQSFPKQLLRAYIQHEEEIEKHIHPNLKNWDVERIAVMDMVLMKMAVCELLYLPNVPVKVSINEYIDISKIYSTPKSKDFVNGVLDKTKKQLTDLGLIKKQGRGLMQ